MREENIQQLKDTNKGIDNVEYLAYKYYFQDLFGSFKDYAKGRLLDIGCGNKPFSTFLKPLITEHVGCDIVQSSERSVDILCAANNIPLGSNSFDTVISTQTIEHVEDHQGLVNEAFRLLKPGGHFIVSGPMYWPLHEEPYDFFRFTKHGFTYILQKSGFRIAQIKSNGGKWALCGQVMLQTIYPDVQNEKTFKGYGMRLLFKMMGGVKGFNRFFSKMDDKYKDERNTMNYVVVATK